MLESILFTSYAIEFFNGQKLAPIISIVPQDSAAKLTLMSLCSQRLAKHSRSHTVNIKVSKVQLKNTRLLQGQTEGGKQCKTKLQFSFWCNEILANIISGLWGKKCSKSVEYRPFITFTNQKVLYSSFYRYELLKVLPCCLMVLFTALITLPKPHTCQVKVIQCWSLQLCRKPVTQQMIALTYCPVHWRPLIASRLITCPHETTRDIYF